MDTSNFQHPFDPSASVGPAPSPPTFGSKTVRLESSDSYAAQSIKRKAAALIDELNDLRDTTDLPEQRRLASTAITHLQGACMWAVDTVDYQG